MKIYAETPRLILREILPSDEEGMFALDSDPEVHRYLGNNPVTNIEQTREVINFVRQQYIDNGIARWAVIEKNTNSFVGWSGLKLVKEERNNHPQYYDIGYRFIKKYWGKGYATESAKAALDYGFEVMNLTEIIGTAHIENTASRKVLEKIGLKYIEKFMYDDIECNWLRITRREWENNIYIL